MLSLIACKPAEQPAPAAPALNDTLRLATFNVAMGMPGEGDLARALQDPNHSGLRSMAAIIQRLRPDVLLLNEFDYDPGVDAARLLDENFLGISQVGQAPFHLPYHFRAPVNTGEDSGLDLNGNGVLGEPEDAWGYGRFAGQYGMLVLSRFPILAERSRSFQHFRWAELPEPKQPMNPDGTPYYPDEIWRQLRLSSKSHWDVAIDVAGHILHFLVFHPTPPVFDGPEDRNGLRNFDEIRFWTQYLSPESTDYLVDDQGRSGGLPQGESFVIAGDFNSDPLDGDSIPGAAAQLLDHRAIDSSCVPASEGGFKAARAQGRKNYHQWGDPGNDTADFNDEQTGNLRLDYVLPSVDLTVTGCGVYWPALDNPGQGVVEFSDHRLVWIDIRF